MVAFDGITGTRQHFDQPRNNQMKHKVVPDICVTLYMFVALLIV